MVGHVCNCVRKFWRENVWRERERESEDVYRNTRIYVSVNSDGLEGN